MKLTPIPAERVDVIWPWAAPLLDRACKHPTSNETTESLHAKVKSGHGYILVVIDDDTPMVLERSDHCLHVVSMGGRNIVGRINDLVNACSIVAGYVGAKGISYKGRKGWRRLLAPFGFHETPDGFMEMKL